MGRYKIRHFISSALLTALTASLASCLTMPMPNYPPLPASGDPDLSWLVVRKGVNDAGWEIRQMTNDRLVVERNVRTHTMVVAVTRSEDGFATEYVDSTNLQCNPPPCSRIYKAYDRRVRDLRAAIAKSLENPRTYEQLARDVAIDAASAGNVSLLQGLLSLEVNLDGAGYSYSDTSPLIEATIMNRTEMVELLLDNGADPDLAVSDGNTALHLAAFFVRSEIAALLLSRQADPNVRNTSGQTPLLLALSVLSATTIADLNARSPENEAERELLDWARVMPRTGIVGLLLLEHGGDPNQTDHQGISPLMLAEQNGLTDVRNALIALGAEPIEWQQQVSTSGVVHRRHGGQNAYGPGIHSDATGRPYTWQPTLGHTGGVLGPVQPNAYGPGIGMDATGKPVRATPHRNGIPVYGASQCVGPVIMGRCHGSTIGPPRKTCHGTMLNGRCTGPMF